MVGGVRGCTQLSEILLPTAATPTSALTLLSRLFCVLALMCDVSTIPLFSVSVPVSFLLLAPVDIKVIKDLPWPPPVGQLDSSPSLPDGDRDISGPASPLPEPSLEDSSGGSCGGFWPFPAQSPSRAGWEWRSQSLGLEVGLEDLPRAESGSHPGGSWESQNQDSLPAQSGESESSGRPLSTLPISTGKFSARVSPNICWRGEGAGGGGRGVARGWGWPVRLLPVKRIL